MKMKLGLIGFFKAKYEVFKSNVLFGSSWFVRRNLKQGYLALRCCHPSKQSTDYTRIYDRGDYYV